MARSVILAPGAENLITSALKSVDVGVYDMLDALTEGNVMWPGGGIYILEGAHFGEWKSSPKSVLKRPLTQANRR